MSVVVPSFEETQLPDVADPARGFAVRVDRVSKVYHLYARPQDRLKEMLLGRRGRRFSRDFWALHDVSFELPRGRRLGLIGRNGSGKSTLLQILAGTLTATGGDVDVRGRVAALLELGSGFNPEYTGRENIYLNASILGLSREEIDARFDDIAAFADIGEFLDQPVKTYSSGMFMRLGFAVTTSVDADLLLIDEALAVGDVFFTQKCFSHLERLIDRGVSVILVTHDASAINQFCDSVIVLNEGRVVFNGDTVGGLRTYFALQRSNGNASANANANGNGKGSGNGQGVLTRSGAVRVPSGVARLSAPWPDAADYLPLDDASTQGTNQARCTAVALCDDAGRATDVFQMGDEAVFYYEFEVDAPLDVPIGGVSLVNERNLIVHGRNTVQHALPVSEPVAEGSRLRFRQRMRLDVAPGRYTFVLGLATMTADDYAQASHMSHTSLHERTTRVLSIANVASFSVTLRRDGLELPFHGLCNLGGDAELAVIPPAGPAARPARPDAMEPRR